MHLKQHYENLTLIFTKLKYEEHRLMKCSDLKVLLSMLLGQFGGYIKHHCFLSEWDNRDGDQHWIKKQHPSRTALEPGSNNVICESLSDPRRILLPALLTKLGLIKRFVKALPKEGVTET